MATAINPFGFPMGVSLAEHTTNLLACFEGAFPLVMPLPALVERAINTVYRDLGWSIEDVNEGKKNFPTMSRFLQALQSEAKSANYPGEIAGNIKAMLDVRFRRLNEGLSGRAFSGEDDGADKVMVEPDEWLQRPIILELESLGANYANFMTLLVLTQIREALSVSPSSKLRHVLILEEAHNLIGPSSYSESGENADPKTAATAYIVKLLAEVRALGQGIIIADQLPSKLAPEVLKNTSLKICHRLVSGDDRGQMGQTMQASAAQLEHVASLLPGQALVSFEGLQRPFVATMNLADKDLRHINDRLTDKQYLGF
jgi:DNA helicase HerA-like ATPase